MSITYSPFNNFRGGVLRFFYPKIRKVPPKGYLTVGSNGAVEIDPMATVVVPNEIYTVKPEDRVLILPIYGVPGGGNGGQNVLLPSPSSWPGRTLTIVRLGYDTSGDTFTWRLIGLFTQYANSVITYNPSYLGVPGTIGKNTPPFATAAESTFNLGNDAETSVFTLMSDGVGWFDAIPKLAASVEP